MVLTRNLHEKESNKWDSRGNVKVAIQDQYTDIVDYYLTMDTGEFTLTENTVIDSNSFTVEAGHNISVGNTLTFKEGTKLTQAQVINVNTNTITIDSPMDRVYNSGSSHKNGIRDMAVNGSTTTQVFYFSAPPSGMIDITRVSFVLVDSTAMDFTTFGGIGALARGCVLRMHDGYKYNLFNIKTNGELINRCSVFSFKEKTGGGSFGLSTICTFAGSENRGVTVRLFGEDRIELLIQDNLTALDTFRVIVQGHFTEP